MYIALFLSFVSCSNHNHGPSCAGITQLMRPGGNAFPHWPLLWHSRSSEVITSPLRPQHAGTVPTKTPFFRHQLRGTSLFFIRAPGIHEVKFAHPSLVSLIYLPHRCLRCHYHPRSMQTWWYRCSISSTRSYIRRPLRVALWTVWCSPVVQGAVILLIANFELLLVVAAASGGCVLVTGGVAWNLPILFGRSGPGGRILASRGSFASCCFSPSPGLLSLKARTSDTLGLLFIGDSTCQTARLLD